MYATEGYPSLFEFCVTRLHLSESQAYHRIQAARAARRFPLVLERLREGRVSLTAVALLREHLTEANHREVLGWADGRCKRQTVEKSNGAAMPGAEPVSHRVRGRTTSGGRRSRDIPARVRRAVWDRDGGCCAFVSANGTRCTATAALEFHHRIPFAEDGASTVDNISLACAVHNAVEAARWFNFDRTEFGVGESGSRGPVGGAASRSAPSTAPAASTALS